MVRGLTTFINQRMNHFMDDYVLPHDSYLVIDGDSVAMNIYRQMEDKNTCFGGDYDKYADKIKTFFKKLLDCKVTPYILFDGATDPKNVGNASQRLNDRVKRCIEINPMNEDEIQIFPLLVTEVFKSLIMELNISNVMCDFDCDKEVANVARKLNCPLLAYDSDYFIYDVKYIPFVLDEDEQNLFVFRNIETNKKHLRCKIFNRDKFLQRTKLTLDHLPILAVYLGTDSVERVQNVGQFCKYLNLGRGNFVELIIRWLGTKKPEEAVKKMLDFFVGEQKKRNLKDLINEVIEDYKFRESPYLKYLQQHLLSEKKDTNEDIDNESNKHLKNVSSLFIRKYRRGCYDHKFLDILLFHEYHPKPLVENVQKEHGFKCCFPIIDAIHKILTDNSSENLLFHGRVGLKVCEQIVPKCEKELPYYDQIEEMSTEIKLNYFLEILNIENEFVEDCLELFPNSWHILLITLKYMRKLSKADWPFVSTLVLSKIMLSHVDKKVGYIRNLRDFDRFASKYIDIYDSNCSSTEQITNVSQAVEEIDINDSARALEKMLPYFQISAEIRNDLTLFDRNLVHQMSEFQSCLFHIDCLNDLFCKPFEKCCIWECFNGTFIYNIFSQLQKNPDFIYNLMESTPTILRCFNSVITFLKTHIN